VVGFETSDCCRSLLGAIAALGYTYEQYILTPTQYGMPNERPRYYLVACRSRRAEAARAVQNETVAYSLPGSLCAEPCAPLSDFIDEMEGEELGSCAANIL